MNMFTRVPLIINPRGGGYSTKFYRGRLRPEVIQLEDLESH